MEPEDILSLIEVAQRLGLAELQACKAGVTLRLQRETQAPTAARPAPPARPAQPVASNDLAAPLAGVLHLAPAPGAPPFVTPGQPVRRGETLCLIEAMKVFSRIAAPADGRVAAVLVESGAEIEAGQILMRIA